MNYESFDKALDLIIKAEIHSLMLIFSGAVVAIKGHPEVGTPIISAGLMAFKGDRK